MGTGLICLSLYFLFTGYVNPTAALSPEIYQSWFLGVRFPNLGIKNVPPSSTGSQGIVVLLSHTDPQEDTDFLGFIAEPFCLFSKNLLAI